MAWRGGNERNITAGGTKACNLLSQTSARPHFCTCQTPSRSVPTPLVFRLLSATAATCVPPSAATVTPHVPPCLPPFHPSLHPSIHLFLQALFVLLLLPITCQLKGLSLTQLPAYLRAGSSCLMGGNPGCGADCAGAPLLPVLYVGVNVVSVGGCGCVCSTDRATALCVLWPTCVVCCAFADMSRASS